MYNRYIPQPDGTYRRNRMPDLSRPVPPKPPDKPMQEHCPPPVQEVCHPETETHRIHKPESCPHKGQEKCPASSSVGNFLKNLLPKDFDTGDLVRVLLHLLMTGDCAEDQITAQLTLAI